MIRFVGIEKKEPIAGYTALMSQLLRARGVNSPEEAARFLSPHLSDLHDPMLLIDMAKAVALITRARDENWQAVVYGDYDVDGISGTAVMCEGLRAFGLMVSAYIPSRHQEGYGLNADAIRLLAGEAKLLVTVDCGITAVEEVALARDLGMAVIVTDHHIPGEVLPDADALINPKLGAYPEPELCGTATAWKLATALLGLDRAKPMLDLVALATIADLVPLLGENRALTAFGLKALQETKRPGLLALAEAAGIKLDSLSAGQVAFQLAPRLNASGRLALATEALEMMEAQTLEEAQPLAQHLNELNLARRDEETRMVAEAHQQVDAMPLHKLRSLVVVGEGWNSGVVGLVAGRLAEAYHLPTIALAQEGDTLSGSARSAGQVHLFNAICNCAPLLTRFGGHEKAAGLALTADKLADFKKAFDRAVRAQGDPLIPTQRYEWQMPLGDLTVESVEALAPLAPHGMGNPTPLMLASDVSVIEGRAVGAEGRHLRLVLEEAGTQVSGISFGQGDKASGLPARLSVVYQPDINRFNGRVSAQMLVKALRPGSQSFRQDSRREAWQFLQDLRHCDTIQTLHRSVVKLAANTMPDDFFPPDAQGRGSLILCRSAATAQRLSDRFPDMDQCHGTQPDRRGFDTVALGVSPGPWVQAFDRVLFADGMSPADALWLSEAQPQIQFFAWPKSQAFQEMVQALLPDKDVLRDYYLSIRQGLAAAPDSVSAVGMCHWLSLAGLVDWPQLNRRPVLLPPHKVDPLAHPAVRVLKDIINS